MTIDASGNIYVTGTTTSTDASSATDQFPASTLPQALPFQSLSAGARPGAVLRDQGQLRMRRETEHCLLDLFWRSALAATTPPVATGGGIAVDTNGNVYFTGTTNYIYYGHRQ